MKENNGLSIELMKDELVIKGSKSDLLELSDYVKRVATSELEKDHIHIDELSLIDDNSRIKNLMIEKR